jgi:hypothetical protein
LYMASIGRRSASTWVWNVRVDVAVEDSPWGSLCGCYSHTCANHEAGLRSIRCVSNWSRLGNVVAVGRDMRKKHMSVNTSGGYICLADTPYTLDVDKMTLIDPS